MYRLSLIPILILFCHILPAQEKLLPFSIAGTINADTGIVAINLFYAHDYYPEMVNKMETEVKDGKFSFSGSIPYPQGYTMEYGQQYASRLFVIDPGRQTMVVNLDNNREVPLIENASMQEYFGAYEESYKKIRVKRERHNAMKDSLRQHYGNEVPDSLQLKLERDIKGIYAAGDSVLLNYVRLHPDSYVALWKLIELFAFDGSNPIFNSIIAQFSDSLKTTYAGRVLVEKLAMADALLVGKKFPVIDAVGDKNNPLTASVFSGNKYTFVDFWYSSCRPCIAQFPHLRQLYAEYKDKGFGILGISTDREKYKNNWLKAIEKFQLSWPQYWDKNGIESSRLSINKFPTSYLLDSQGNIIKKDLRPVELEQFLRQNM